MPPGGSDPRSDKDTIHVSSVFDVEPESVWIATSWATNTLHRSISASCLDDLQMTVHILITAALAHAVGPIEANLAFSNGAVSVVFDVPTVGTIEGLNALGRTLDQQADALNTHASRWGGRPRTEGQGLALWAEVVESHPSPASLES